MEIRYFGWSGVTIRHGDVVVGVDLFGDAVTWDALGGATTIILFLTHGHPEHCGSLRRFLSQPGARPDLSTTHLISSAAVLDHVARGTALPAANAHPLEAGVGVAIDGTRVTAFAWKHMPLLPPGIRPKIAYAAHLLSHPIELMRIGLSGLRLPMRAPMLGFHMTFADGRTVLNYAEGLHRLTDPREVEAVAQERPAEVLLFAVEPENVAAIPRWINVLRPTTIFLYEAHRPWRELFRLPYVDLETYAIDLSNRFRQMRFGTLIHPGQAVTVADGNEWSFT